MCEMENILVEAFVSHFPLKSINQNLQWSSSSVQQTIAMRCRTVGQRTTSNASFFSTWHSLALSHRKQLIPTSLQCNILKVPGKVTLSRLWSKSSPKIKVSRLSGKVTPSRLWLKSCPKDKLRRLLGNVTPSKLWLKWYPKVIYSRLSGKVTRSKLWLNWFPKIKFCRLVRQDHAIPNSGWTDFTKNQVLQTFEARSHVPDSG